MSDHLFEKPDPLVPDPRVAEEFGVSLMTLWRWDHDSRMAELGWKPPVKIRNRNYRSRSVLEKVKATAMGIGIASLKSPQRPRKAKVAPSAAERTSEKTPVNAALESRVASNTSDPDARLPNPGSSRKALIAT